MFETVKEDIRVGTLWHEVPLARRLFGERGAKAAAVLLSMELQAVLIYRLQVWSRKRRIPLLPNLCQRLTMLLAGVSIGDFAVIGPGLLLNHGHVVIDGFTSIGRNCSIAPFVTIGLNTGGPDPSFAGPKLGSNVFVGTGAKILGDIEIGDNARIGANAVVMSDVPANSTAVGVPARVLKHQYPLGPVEK